MRIASVSEAKNKLSALLDLVRSGESVLIVDRGRPVARLEPAVSADDPEGRIARLERAGILRSGKAARVVFDTPPPKPRRGWSAVAAVLAERREGR